MQSDGNGKGERLRTQHIFKGRAISLSLDSVRLPNGVTIDLELARHPGASAVVPVDAQGQVTLVRQYRYATLGWLLEVPAGKLDAGEQPEACARREVREETGLIAGKLESLGWIWTTPGFCDERIWLFVATELQQASQELGHDELLHTERLPLVEAVRLARSGEITDAKSVCALLRTGSRFGL